MRDSNIEQDMHRSTLDERSACEVYDYLSGLGIALCTPAKRKEIFNFCMQALILTDPLTGLSHSDNESKQWRAFWKGTTDKNNKFFQMCVRQSKAIAFHKWAEAAVEFGQWEEMVK